MSRYRGMPGDNDPEMIDFEGFDDIGITVDIPKEPANTTRTTRAGGVRRGITPVDEEPEEFEPAVETGELKTAAQRRRRAVASANKKSRDIDDDAFSDPSANADGDPVPGIWRTLANFFQDKRTHLFLGISLLICTLYVTIAFVSFFSTALHDQNEVANTALPLLVNNPETVKNTGGPIGAWVSNTLINGWFGIGSLILVVYMAICSFMLLGVYKARFVAVTFRCLLFAVATSLILGYVTLHSSSHIYWGGLHGYYVMEWMNNACGPIGSLGLAIIALVLVVALFFNDLAKICNKWAAAWAKRREKIRAMREAEAEAEAEAERQKERENALKATRENAEAEKKETEAAATAEDVKRQNTYPETDTVFQPAEETQHAASEDNILRTVGNLKVPGPERIDIPNFPTPVVTGEMEVEVPQLEEADSKIDTSPTISVADVPTGDLSTPYDPRADLPTYQFPGLDLLRDLGDGTNCADAVEQEENKEIITKTLADYGFPIASIKATVGPTVTLYEIVPVEGNRIAKIKSLEDDIALSLGAEGVRIIGHIPGKRTIGIEVPNKDKRTVSIRSILGSKAFSETRMELPMALGCTIQNEVFIADLAKMPHLLVAGATGMGKSVGLNTIISSLLYKRHPAELKFVLVDPKMVEFSLYGALERHFLAKLPDEQDAIITQPSKVVTTLNSLCVEMDNRYQLLKKARVRSIKEYNTKFIARQLNPENGHNFMPYIVVIVDEFADLMMTAGKEVETPIARIAQKARAVGIHMILATQRPSTNIITGVIKANFPSRMAFRVFQMVDSRTILDCPGANQLIGRGDMLFSNNGRIERVQCAFIDTPEVEAICHFIDDQAGYPTAYELPEYVPEDAPAASLNGLNDRDDLFEDCARLVVASGTASTSNLQRRYSVGYNRAGKIMDQLERAGIVGPVNGSKPRQVLMDAVQLEGLLANLHS